MNPERSRIPQPSPEALQRWKLEPIEYWGGRSNQHWLVESRGGRLVLRGYSNEFDDIDYELEVLSRLRAIGWPVPALAEEPMHVEGRT